MLVGKEHVLEMAMEEDGSGDLLGARQGDAERALAREEIRVRESCFMRPAVESEVEFQKPRVFRRSPSERHIEDSAKCC